MLRYLAASARLLLTSERLAIVGGSIGWHDAIVVRTRQLKWHKKIEVSLYLVFVPLCLGNLKNPVSFTSCLSVFCQNRIDYTCHQFSEKDTGYWTLERKGLISVCCGRH